MNGQGAWLYDGGSRPLVHYQTSTSSSTFIIIIFRLGKAVQIHISLYPEDIVIQDFCFLFLLFLLFIEFCFAPSFVFHVIRVVDEPWTSKCRWYLH